MSFKESRTLVTGGAGFIGSALARTLLKTKAEVTVFDDFSSGSMLNINDIAENVKIVRGDIRDFELVRKIVADQDFVFHLAANASVPISSENPRYDFEVNSVGTFNVLESLLRLNQDAPLVFASSAAVYGDQEQMPLSEDSELKPLSPYGANKLAGETLCKAFYRNYGLPSVSLRFFNVYGPPQRKYVMFDMMNKLHSKASSLEVLGTGNQLRDFTYVSDTVNACLLMAKTSSAFGESYNVGTGVGTTIRQLVELLLDVLGLRDKVKIFYTNKSWKGDVQKLVADIGKIRKFGFQPKTDFRTGLTQFIQWYRLSFLKEQGKA